VALPRLREDRAMPTYIMLLKLTDQGIKNVRESPSRQDAARELARKFGVKWTSICMTMGDYDFVNIVEAPDDQAIAKYALSLGALGNIRTTTLKAFPEAEYRDIIQALA
jgi:uncharacterized protein with GYD domain